MNRTIVVAAALGLSAWNGPAGAAGGRLCPSLARAWTAARADPASTVGLSMAGASTCSTSHGDFRCTWVFADAAAGRRSFGEMGTAAAACMRRYGLSPHRKVINGVETLALETPTTNPNVDLFYPGGITVTIAIVTDN